MDSDVVNVVIAGTGGQGVIKASDILADAAFRSDRDVKKSELHGMSQRGGSVASDVRFGAHVFSPMVPAGEADFLVVLADEEVDANRGRLAGDGVLIVPAAVDAAALPAKECLNVALLGVLSNRLEISEEHWLAAIRANLPARYHEMNLAAFRLGRAADSDVKR